MNEHFLCRHSCLSCGHDFYGPEIGGDPYGRFLLYSNHQEYCLINCIGEKNEYINDLFKELSSYVRNLTFIHEKFDQHDLARACIGLMCNPSENGNPYYYDSNIVEGRKCFACGSNLTEIHILDQLEEKMHVPNANFPDGEICQKKPRE